MNELEQFVEIPVDMISPSSYQPRQLFDQAKIQELADSIKAKGLIEPIVVRPLNETREGTYELISGERRLRAYKFLEKPTIPAIVRIVSAEEAHMLALIENLQREDLTVMEEARCLNVLVIQHGGDREQVAKEIGKKVPYLNERISLLTLPAEVQILLEQKRINIAQAKVVLSLTEEKDQIDAARLAAKLNLTANELKGRMQRKMKARGEGREPGTVPYSQLTRFIVWLFDLLQKFDLDMLRDLNKRETLRKQIVALQRALARALEKLEASVEVEPYESEVTTEAEAE